LLRAAKAARKVGTRRVIALVTRGLFMPGAAEVLADPAIDRLVVTDTVPPFRLPAGSGHDKLVILSAAPLLAEAIARLHDHRALTDLLEAARRLGEALETAQHPCTDIGQRRWGPKAAQILITASMRGSPAWLSCSAERISCRIRPSTPYCRRACFRPGQVALPVERLRRGRPAYSCRASLRRRMGADA
jgi:hypothetical protein